MPLVLTQNEATASGHEYADVLGRSYEYPIRYRRLLREGERFVYYRGRRTAAGTTEKQAYLGTGLIGDITESPVAGRLICQVVDYKPFPEPLPFKEGDQYREGGAHELGGGSRTGMFFRTGVREIADADYEAIVAAAWASISPEQDVPPLPSQAYASPELSREVDAIAMGLAMAEAKSRWPTASVRRMPHNNPGYDLRVERDGETWFIEVKGTTRTSPVFFLTEGERVYSVANSQHYSLWVFFAIDLSERSGQLRTLDGALTETNAGLNPRQWSGSL